jgi:hypothetical protein
MKPLTPEEQAKKDEKTKKDMEDVRYGRFLELVRPYLVPCIRDGKMTFSWTDLKLAGKGFSEDHYVDRYVGERKDAVHKFAWTSVDQEARTYEIVSKGSVKLPVPSTGVKAK